MQQALLGVLVGFFASFIVAPFTIKLFRKLKNGQPILHYVESHMTKSGTPTMGGVIFLFGSLVTYLLFLNFEGRLALLCLATMFGYGLLGFMDDFIKVKWKHNLGLRAYQKALGQLGIALIMAIYVYNSPLVGTNVVIPFSNLELNLGWFIVPFVVFVYVALTNSVNLTDGLDGLAGSMVVVYLMGFMVSLFLRITQLENTGASLLELNELKGILILCGGVFGAVLCFLWFNSHPASVFMGDTGSLALGGFLTSISVLTKLYLFIPLFGIMFVVTALSDVLQVGYYKLTKKRIFLMAPLHHHFEKKGWHETKIVAIYIILTSIVTVTTVAFLV